MAHIFYITSECKLYSSISALLGSSRREIILPCLHLTSLHSFTQYPGAAWEEICKEVLRLQLNDQGVEKKEALYHTQRRNTHTQRQWQMDDSSTRGCLKIWVWLWRADTQQKREILAIVSTKTLKPSPECIKIQLDAYSSLVLSVKLNFR